VHVLVEKPLAGTLEEGRALVDLARGTDVRVGVNYQYRYDAGCYALARAARSGALGRLYYGRCNVPWHRDETYFAQGAWRGQRARAGGGTLLTQGSHAFDVLLWALGGRPVAATGQTARREFEGIDVEDVAQGTVALEGGALAQVSSAMVARPEQAVTLEVYGERGTAIYADRPWPRVRFRGVRVRRARPPVRGLHALQRSLAAFGAWVMEGKPYLTPAAEALPVLAAVDAIYRAAASGCREAVDLWPPSEGQRAAAVAISNGPWAGERG
jgi:predicted dehydrogenase